jgi:hypothetical protein
VKLLREVIEIVVGIAALVAMLALFGGGPQ